MADATTLLTKAKRIVVKVGSSLIANGDVFRHDGLAGDLSAWPAETLLISSGAVALGHRAAPDLSRESLAERQALSSIGQPLLMATWEQALGGANARSAQVLLTPDVTDDPVRRDNAKATIGMLLKSGLLPIVNENDAVATDELRYGDNDGLAAQTAKLIGADLLVLLTNVQGFFDADPTSTPNAEHWPTIPDAVMTDPAGHIPDDKSSLGTGGMRSKVEAARYAVEAGIPVIIGSGAGQRPLTAIKKGEARCSLALPKA
ncbi:MAG: glutamate 5-kinase [Parvularculaceae bacterium]|nr:glutamate 5-kinase [Parvularculaceae bacterium]